MAHRLLLADDSVTIQRVIELTFADEDIEVTAVGDGQRAIDLIKTERPDIVLADADMPERTGFEVASFVKSAPELAHTRVILLTGAFEVIDQARARDAGCDAVLAKPFEPQMLITRVKELLASRPAARVPASPAAAVAPAPDAPTWSAKPPAAEPPSADPGAGNAPFDQAQGRPEQGRGTSASRGADPARANPQGSKQPVSLDDYFDQLDAAFASKASGPLGSAPTPEQPVRQQWPAPSAEQQWIPPRPVVAVTPTPARIEPAVREIQASTPSVRPAPACVAPPLATTFSALLAAEQGEPLPPGALPATGQLPAAALDAVAEEVTSRVVRQLADRALREQLASLVSTIAERLVREEIERVKGTIK